MFLFIDACSACSTVHEDKYGISMEGYIDWKLCCLCQDRFSDTELRSTTEGRESLGKKLMQFKDNGMILPGIFNTCLE